MLKQHALRATLWSGADIILRQGLQFLVSVVLARLLTPAEFGTVALLALFTGIATVFIDGGFSAALIQRQDTNHDDESTVFWFNFAAGVIVALALFALAPAIAALYQLPVLKLLTVAMALNVLIGAMGAIHATLLSKRLEFRTQMKISAVATLASGIVATAMAWNGFGVWSLAAQSLVMTSVTTGLLWIVNPWRPDWIFSRTSARKLFGFGGYHLASTLLDTMYSRLYTLLIGKLYGTRELGFYNSADVTKQLPGGFLTTVLVRVAFPMFAVNANDKAKLRRGVQLSIRGMMLLNVPIMLGMTALADPLVRILFGSQWLPVIPILRVLCIAGMLFPVHVINLQVLMAQGHSDLMFRVEVTKKLLGVVFIGVGALNGVMGIAWSQVAFSFVGLAINARFTQRFLDYGVAAQLRDFVPIVSISAVMAAIVYALEFSWQPDPMTALAVLGVVGVVIFFGLARLARLDALRDVVELFRSVKQNASEPPGNATL